MYSRSFTWYQKLKILAHNIFWLHGLESYGEFFMGKRLIPLVHENCCNCDSQGKSTQMSSSSTHTKCPNRGRANTFLTCTNEHYAANLCGVNAQLPT
jgi:hypothetical protein